MLRQKYFDKEPDKFSFADAYQSKIMDFLTL
jgi:hypothetical protein